MFAYLRKFFLTAYTHTSVFNSEIELIEWSDTFAGGEKAGVTPVIQSFDKMKIYDESKLNSGEKQSLIFRRKTELTYWNRRFSY